MPMAGLATGRSQSVSTHSFELLDRDAFTPSAGRARRFDHRLREVLAESIALLADAITAVDVVLGSRLRRGIDPLLLGPVSPIAFALYSDLVRAASRDDFDTLRTLANAWCEPQFGSADRGEQIVNLTDDDLGVGNAARVARVIDDEAEAPLSPQSVAEESLTEFRFRFDEAMTLIRTVDPEVAGEIDVFCRRVILGEPRPGTRNFGGGTTFFLWGATLINPQGSTNRIALVSELAHEATHALLFGLAEAKPLTTNSPDERYASPLRPEPRPLEGILHATVVLARVNHLLIKISREDDLSAEEREILQENIGRHARLCRSGMATVDSHARLTPEGHAIFESCRAAARAPNSG